MLVRRWVMPRWEEYPGWFWLAYQDRMGVRSGYWGQGATREAGKAEVEGVLNEGYITICNRA